MRLSDYIDQNTTRGVFAARIRVSTMALSRYCNGLRMPKPRIMARIAAATGGKVTANDFFVPAARRVVRRARRAAPGRTSPRRRRRDRQLDIEDVIPRGPDQKRAA